MISQKEIKKTYEIKVGKIAQIKKGSYFTIFSTYVNSEENPNKLYRVTISVRIDGSIRFKCACKAGKNKLMCKHVLKVYNKIIIKKFKPDVVLG